MKSSKADGWDARLRLGHFAAMRWQQEHAEQGEPGGRLVEVFVGGESLLLGGNDHEVRDAHRRRQRFELDIHVEYHVRRIRQLGTELSTGMAAVRTRRGPGVPAPRSAR